MVDVVVSAVTAVSGVVAVNMRVMLGTTAVVRVMVGVTVSVAVGSTVTV